MISRSPSEYYIKYLISKRDYEDPDIILKVLEDYNLLGIGTKYIERLIEGMEPFPEPWTPNDRTSETTKYLKEHKIYNLWFPDSHVKEAYEILSLPQIREDVERLLIAPLRLEEVLRRINKQHPDSIFTLGGIRSFRHYFWNRRLLSMHEWEEVLNIRPDWETTTSVLRSSPDVADTLVPWMLGYAGPPANLNTGTVARRLRDVAFLKILEIERKPATLAHSKMLKNYMDVVKGAESEMRHSDVALRDVLKAFEKFRLLKDDDAIPSIEQVAGPNYSRSGEGTDNSGLLEDVDWEEKDDRE